MKKWILNHRKSSTAIFLAVLTLLFCGRLIFHLTYIAFTDDNEDIVFDPGYVDDASRQESTKLQLVTPSDNFEIEVRALLLKARAEKRRVSIAGARHSMGGHTMYPGGICISTRNYRDMSIDVDSKILTVQSGATWQQIIEYLDQYGLAVKVMQSNFSFSVGGSLSANCHGWQHNQPPIGSTVLSMTVMLADGSVRNCSRRENRELFNSVLGGYGLLGVILEVKLQVVENHIYQARSYLVTTDKYLEEFQKIDDQVGMVYGRFNVSAENFLNELIFVKFNKSEQKIDTSLIKKGKYLSRLVFRGSALSQYGKKIRWQAETGVGNIEGKLFSRNQLCYSSVDWYRNTSAESTDVLHEYFIPKNDFEAFVTGLQKILPEHKANLLNITVRNVLQDKDSLLTYARTDVFGFVMLFNQKLNHSANIAMQMMTRELIDLAAKCGGSYYLPYRLHATYAQLLRAYPLFPGFIELKQKYDPESLFQNKFYLKYRQLKDSKSVEVLQ